MIKEKLCLQTEQKSISVPGRAVTDTAASGGSSMFPTAVLTAATADEAVN